MKDWAAIMTGGLLSSQWTLAILFPNFLHLFWTKQCTVQWVLSKQSDPSEMTTSRSDFCCPESHCQQAGQPGWLPGHSQPSQDSEHLQGCHQVWSNCWLWQTGDSEGAETSRGFRHNKHNSQRRLWQQKKHQHIRRHLHGTSHPEISSHWIPKSTGFTIHT